jgi:hypothetical protein
MGKYAKIWLTFHVDHLIHYPLIIKVEFILGEMAKEEGLGTIKK